MNKHYFIFAGESSGDLHGGHLIQALKLFSPKNTFSGVGGPAMRAQGLDTLLKMEEFQVMGFSDVLKSLPKLWRNFKLVYKNILEKKPDCVILIDYPGFNLRLAKKLRQKGFCGKIVQYISPTVWAHGKNRITAMAQNLDLLLTIFPFEPPCFAHTDLPVRYVGNPLTHNIQSHAYQEDWYLQMGLESKERLIAIFPGSRKEEIKRNLPLQLAAAALYKQKVPSTKLGISCAHKELVKPIQDIIQQSKNKDVFLIPKNFTYELMRDSDIALAKSGTVTLELALHQRPSVIVYQLNQLNYWFAKYFLKLRLPFYCIVNILANKEVFPELIGTQIDPQHICHLLEELEKKRKKILADCVAIQTTLGKQNANQEAAKAIVEQFEKK